MNYYYPFPYGKKIFFRYTENGFTKLKGGSRLFIRYIELVYSLLRVLFFVWRKRPRLVNFSLISTLWPVVFFLRCVRSIKDVKLVMTCHDAMPFQSIVKMESSINRMRYMFSLSDYVLAHTPSSVDILVSYWGIKEEVIVNHLFPLLDLTSMPGFQSNPVRKTIDFLFIGFIRKEKGVDLLLDAWKIVNQTIPNANLVVAGALPVWYNLDFSDCSDLNVRFEIGFVDDNRYVELVKSAKYVVLPYTKGTNSGVVSTVLSLGTNVITSDITMFRENSLLNKELMFKSGDPLSLANILIESYNQKDCNFSQGEINNYRDSFEDSVNMVYNKILK